MRSAAIYYNDDLAGVLVETGDGEYEFSYNKKYIREHPDQFITFTMPVREQVYKDKRLFPFFEGLIPEGLLAPAYDLLNVSIVNPEDKEELTLTLEGKKSNFFKSHFDRFGLGLELTLKQVGGVYKRMQKNKSKTLKAVEMSFLSPGMQEAYKVILEQRYENLFG